MNYTTETPASQRRNYGTYAIVTYRDGKPYDQRVRNVHYSVESIARALTEPAYYAGLTFASEA